MQPDEYLSHFPVVFRDFVGWPNAEEDLYCKQNMFESMITLYHGHENSPAADGPAGVKTNPFPQRLQSQGS